VSARTIEAMVVGVVVSVLADVLEMVAQEASTIGSG
jgi:hypothetical protein